MLFNLPMPTFEPPFSPIIIPNTRPAPESDWTLDSRAYFSEDGYLCVNALLESGGCYNYLNVPIPLSEYSKITMSFTYQGTNYGRIAIVDNIGDTTFITSSQLRTYEGTVELDVSSITGNKYLCVAPFTSAASGNRLFTATSIIVS